MKSPSFISIMAEELSYKRKARLRGKNRKIRIEQVYDKSNLYDADKEARKGKDTIGKYNKGVRIFDRNRDELLQMLHDALKNREYHTSEGHECTRMCPCGKERLLHKLPYYPDHIEHHALMRVIMPTMVRYYYYDSSASIKGKGMSFAAKRTMKYIDKNKGCGRLYYAKLDFVKFYHNINQKKCYDVLCKTFGDSGIRYLLWEVITACKDGLGIGLFPIQPIANFYTCDLCRKVMGRFDVWIEIYCDDIVILGKSSREIWKAISFIKNYAADVMCQPLHDNIGVQIIDEHHFLDFVGYRFYLNHTLLRKRMKNKFKRKMHNLTEPMHRYRSASAYKGWLMHCNGYSLWCMIMDMKSFKDLGVPVFEELDPDGKRMLRGTKVSASMLAGRDVIFTDAEFEVKSNFKRPATIVQVEENGILYKFFTANQKLTQTLRYVKEHEAFPFRGKLVRINNNGLPDYEIQ